MTYCVTFAFSRKKSWENKELSLTFLLFFSQVLQHFYIAYVTSVPKCNTHAFGPINMLQFASLYTGEKSKLMFKNDLNIVLVGLISLEKVQIFSHNWYILYFSF